jgi:hypothetical protein
MNLNRCIIIGGGSSIRQELWQTPIQDLPIWNVIKNELTIAINWSYLWCNPTIELFGDYQFYHTEYERLKKLPLIISVEDGYYQRENSKSKLENLFLLKRCRGKEYLKPGSRQPGLHPYYWGKDSWKNGWYDNQLTGIMAITLAINALECKEIYLLGYDATEINGHTHFFDDTEVGKYKYDNQEYYGVGKNEKGGYRTSNYDKPKELNEFWFKSFEQELERGIKIFNVSPQSAIHNFPRISYDLFYDILQFTPKPINQEEVRNYIKTLIKEKSDE